MEKELVKIMQNHGVYFTHLVKELIQIFAKNSKPLSSKDMLNIFNKRNFFPYPSSLNRQLSRLKKLRIINEIIFSDGVKQFFYRSNKNHILFSRCKKCKEVSVHILKKEAQISKILSKHLGKDINTLISEGLCDICNN